MKSTNPNDIFYGFGRSNNQTTSVSKGLGESLERYIATYIYQNYRSLNACSVSVENSEVFIESTVSQVDLIPDTLKSSNGWAVHFDMKTAIKSSILEALERHILLFNYLDSGWENFRKATSGEYNEVSFESILGKYSIAGMAAAMSSASNKSYPGVTLGYCADSVGNILLSKSWLQAFFEAYETSLYFKKNDLNVDKFTDDGSKDLRESQIYYLTNNKPNVQEADFNKFNFESARNSIGFNLSVFDLSDVLGVPFYISHAWGGDFIPLFFKKRLNEEGITYLRASLARNGLSQNIPEIHPVI